MSLAQRLWAQIRSVPGLGRDVLALVVLVAVGIASTGYVLSQYDWQAPWSNDVVVAAEFAKAPAVRPESRQEVRIAGVTVGKVVSAEPLPDGNAKLVMSLDPGHTVYSNATAVLRTKSPINVMYVALDPGGPPGMALPPSATIPVSQTQTLVQPWEVLDKLDEPTRDALTSLLNESDAALANAPQQLPGGLTATDATLRTFQPVVEQLQTRRDKIAQLVTALAQISTAAGGDDQRLAKLVSSLQQTLGTLANRDDELGRSLQELPGFTGDLQAAMTGTSDLTKQLNPTLDALHNASQQLPPTLSRLTTTVQAAGKLVDAASPVVAKARPVLADLRPLAADATAALGDLAPVTGHLPAATERIVPWLPDLAAFVYQTSSAFSLADVNGGLGRANLTLNLTDPTGGGVLPGLTGIGNKAGGR